MFRVPTLSLFRGTFPAIATTTSTTSSTTSTTITTRISILIRSIIMATTDSPAKRIKTEASPRRIGTHK